jgi:hypothetical protein
MNKFIKNVILSTGFFLFVSCTSHHSDIAGYQEKIPCIDIDVDIEHDNSLPVSFVKNISVVKLETNANSLLGEIRKMQITNDRIFILDSDVSETLFVFNKEGHFLFKVGKKGSGPGEYFSINDFFIDDAKQEISIYDANLRKLHYYGWDGAYMRSHSFADFWLFSCCPLDSSHYALDYTKRARNKNKFHLQLVNQNNEIYFNYKQLETDHEYANKFHIAFYNGIDRIFYTPTRCDTLFNLSTSGITDGYAINFGKHKLPTNFLKGVSKSDQVIKLLKSNYCFGIKDVLETDKLLCFKFSCGNIGMPLFYNKNTRITYIQIPYLPFPEVSCRNYLVGYYESFNIKSVIDNAENEYIERWENIMGETNWNLLNNVKEDDNPLIVFYEIEFQE